MQEMITLRRDYVDEQRNITTFDRPAVHPLAQPCGTARDGATTWIGVVLLLGRAWPCPGQPVEAHRRIAMLRCLSSSRTCDDHQPPGDTMPPTCAASAVRGPGRETDSERCLQRGSQRGDHRVVEGGPHQGLSKAVVGGDLGTLVEQRVIHCRRRCVHEVRMLSIARNCSRSVCDNARRCGVRGGRGFRAGDGDVRCRR